MVLSEKKVSVSSPEKIYAVIKSLLDSFDEFEQGKEHFFALGLNNRNVIQYIDLVSIGTVSESLVHPREVFRMAIHKNCSSIILSHNHPSGLTTPSTEDVNITNRLYEAGKILGIRVLDHVIIGDGFCSMKEEHYI